MRSAGQGGTRSRWHRFAWFAGDIALRGVSRRFCLQHPGIEVASGLAWHPDGERLLITFGINDREAWFATVQAEQVRAILLDTDGLLATDPGDATSWRMLPPAGLASPEVRRDRAAPVLETTA
jgi:hypothetical protein